MPGSMTTPGCPSARASALGHVAFRAVDDVGARFYVTFAAQWLAYALPTDASPTPSRTPAHGSGPMWFATLSS